MGQMCLDYSMISIHALREEGDIDLYSMRLVEGQFLSTPSARRATGKICASARTR